MARKEDTGLIEKYIEKIILAVAAVILVVAVVHWGMGSPRRIKLEINARGVSMPQKEYPPDKVDYALETASGKLKDWLEDESRGAGGKPVPNYVRRQKTIFEDPYNDQYVHTYVILGPGRKRLERGKDKGRTIEPVRLADLQPLVQPEKPLVAVSREVQVIAPAEKPAERSAVPAGPEYKEVCAAHGVGVFVYGKVFKKWREALKKTYVPARVVYVALETQRRYRRPDGTWSQPEPVSMVVVPGDPTLPTIPTPDGKNLLEIQQKVGELAWISNQKYILEPPYPDIIWPDRQIGTWQIRNHKPRTRVTDLLEQDEETPAGMERRIMGTEAGERGREGAERRLLDERRAAERRTAERRAAEKRAAERRAAERRAAERRAAERRRSSTGLERGRREVGLERGRREGGPERETVDRRATERRAAERFAAERMTLERRTGERRVGERRTGPGRSPVMIDAPMTVPLPTLQEQLDNPAGILEVWFHDTSLAQGMTYSYRFRLVLANPLLGRFKDVKNKADAKVQTLKTPWSNWSESVTVKRPTEFFLVGNAPQMKTTEVEVFTQRWGQRVSHRFRVAAGEPIGGDISKELLRLDTGEPVSTVVSFKTSAIAVSFNFKKRQRIPGTDFSRTTTELLYLDTGGNLRTRTQFTDEASSRRKDLLNEVRQAAEAAVSMRKNDFSLRDRK